VIDELRTDVTKTRKDGTRGRLRIDYGDHRNPEAAVAWLWKFVVCGVADYPESALRGAGSWVLVRGMVGWVAPDNHRVSRKASSWSGGR
jgi:hypothetical protein